MTFSSASVAAVICRDQASADPQYRAHMRAEAWEVVLPELVYAPTTIEDAAVDSVPRTSAAFTH